MAQAITTALIKRLREETGVGMQACKDVLDAFAGDFDKGKALLRNRGVSGNTRVTK